MSQIPCPQCRGLDWTVVNLCLGCIKQLKGPVTMQLHDCAGEGPPAGKDAIIPVMTEMPEHLKGTELERPMAILIGRQERLEAELGQNRGAIMAMAALHPKRESGQLP